MAQQLRNAHARHIYNELPLPRGTKSITLLHIHPPARFEVDGGPLVADLSVVDLETSPMPQYAALSYVWGAEYSPSARIYLGSNRTAFDLTVNCWSALVSLRAQFAPLTIWVDAICIDQDDTTQSEKNHQVSLMGDLYTKAATTYVWLGPGGEVENRAMMCLSSMGLLEYFYSWLNNESIAERWAAWRATFFLWRRRFMFWTHVLRVPWSSKITRCLLCGQGQCNPYMAATRVKNPPVVTTSDLNAILDRPWIRRVWTYQEIMLSLNPIIICGSTALTWDKLAASVIYLDSTMHKLSTYAEDTLPDGVLFRSLRKWLTLIVGRHLLQSSLYESQSLDIVGQLDPVSYRGFVQDVATHSTHIEGATLLFATILLSFGLVALFLAAGNTSTGVYGYGLNPLWSCTLIYMLLLAFMIYNRQLSHTVSRPRKEWKIDWLTAGGSTEQVLHKSLLSAIWDRQCKESRDYNFGIRNLVQVLSHEPLATLDYSADLGHVYKDLTINLLRFCSSFNILVAMMKNRVHGQPSWVVDWAQGKPDFHYIRDQAWDSDLWSMHPNSFEISARGGLCFEGRFLGNIQSVLRFEHVDAYTEGYLTILESNLQSLRGLSTSRIHQDLSQCLRTLYGTDMSTLWFMQRYQHKTAKDILKIFQRPGLIFLMALPFLHTFPPHFSIIRHSKMLKNCIDLCNKIAASKSSYILFEDDARDRRQQHNAHKRLYIGVVTSTQQVGGPSEDCVRPGDRLVRMKEVYGCAAVVREHLGELRFINAVEPLCIKEERFLHSQGRPGGWEASSAPRASHSFMEIM